MKKTKQLVCVVTAAAIACLLAPLGGCGLLSTARAPGPGDFAEDEVRLFITPGRPFGEITNRFGPARLVRTNGQYSVWHFRSGLPETHPRKTEVICGEPGYVFAGFNLWTTNGLAARWTASDWEKTDASGPSFADLRRTRRLHKTVGQIVIKYLLDQSSTGCCACVVGYPFVADVGTVDDGVSQTAILDLASNRLSRVSSRRFPIPFGVTFMTVTGTVKGPKGKAGVTVLITADGSGEDINIERINTGPLQPLK